MTNHNNIWYESGQAAARYGSEPGTGESDADSRIRSIIQIIQILHGSTMPHLQLFCEEDCGSVCLRSANGDRTWIELEKTNELSQLMKLVRRRNLIKLEMCGIEWTGTLPAVLCNFTELVHLDVSSNQLTGPLSTVLMLHVVFC